MEEWTNMEAVNELVIFITLIVQCTNITIFLCIILSTIIDSLHNHMKFGKLGIYSFVIIYSFFSPYFVFFMIIYVFSWSSILSKAVCLLDIIMHSFFIIMYSIHYQMYFLLFHSSLMCHSSLITCKYFLIFIYFIGS